jgi:hypothetical protein
MITQTTPFADLMVGAVFTFADIPHPLGWPDGPWRKTSHISIQHLENGIDGAVEEPDRATVPYWTEALVREQLPPVQVFHQGRLHDARLSGRSHAFATVTWGTDFICSGEWAWPVIVRCLNDGRPLRA